MYIMLGKIHHDIDMMLKMDVVETLCPAIANCYKAPHVLCITNYACMFAYGLA